MLLLFMMMMMMTMNADQKAAPVTLLDIVFTVNSQ